LPDKLRKPLDEKVEGLLDFERIFGSPPGTFLTGVASKPLALSGKVGVMRLDGLTIAFCVVSVVSAAAQTPIEIQPVKELKPTGTLSTCSYKATETEAQYFGRLRDAEKTNGDMLHGYSIHGKTGTYVAWFGIVRGITPPAENGGAVTLLVEHKYFDGMTDCHIMLVQWTGGGDFTARLKVDTAAIPALSLVRIYGTVTGEKLSVPEVRVDYIRVWPWRTFNFMDLTGNDHTNPRWKKSTQVSGKDIYNPYPKDGYYFSLLGDPADFGLNLRPE
jgi:hypothetical protein